MKVALYINLEPHLTPEQLREFRQLCRENQKTPESMLAELIRKNLNKGGGRKKKAA